MHKTNALGLTRREMQVLAGCSRGMSNPEIANALHLAPNTVKTHLYRIFPKIGAKDRAHAVAIALRAGAMP